MSFLEEEPMSPENTDQDHIFGGSSRNRATEQSTHLDSSHISMDLPGPSSSSDIPGPSTRYPECGILNSTNDTEMQRIRHLFPNNESVGVFGDHADDAEMLPNNIGSRNSMNDATNALRRVLCEHSDEENDENSEFLEDPLPRLHVNPLDSHNDYDSSSREPTDSTDQLFAPEDPSSNSIRNSPRYSLPSGLRTQNSAMSYLKYLSDPQSSSVDELPSLRTSSRYRRFLRSPFSLNDHRDSESPIRIGTTQRLPSLLSPSLSLHRSRLLNSRLRMRSAHTDLLSRHKTTTALNAVASNEDVASFPSGSNELRDLNARPYRRNFFMPKFKVETRFHSHITPSESNNYGYFRVLRPIERSIDNRSPVLRDLPDPPRPYTSSVRARSVSPISVHSGVSSSIHDEPLDDIGINLQTNESSSYPFLNEDFENEMRRPLTPLPPISSPSSSDDDIPPNSLLDNIDNRVVTSPLVAEDAPETCQTVNATTNESTKTNVKEAPRTYDDLNNELIQLLECPICFEFATPPISQCLQGHIVCHTCRQRVSTCPTCRTVFQESRNLIMEKVAALLRYPCRNAVTGCPEFLYLLQKVEHEKACGFRQYACFLPLCTWRGYKPELLVHIQETHENHVVLGPSTNLLIPVSGQTKKVWLMSAFNELFYVIFFTTLSILKGCVRFIGDSSKCENFTYNISVTSEDDMLRNFNYTRMTHAYEESSENNDMFDSYDLFSISHAQLNLFRKGTKAPVRVTIEEISKRGFTTPASSNAS